MVTTNNVIKHQHTGIKANSAYIIVGATSINFINIGEVTVADKHIKLGNDYLLNEEDLSCVSCQNCDGACTRCQNACTTGCTHCTSCDNACTSCQTGCNNKCYSSCYSGCHNSCTGCTSCNSCDSACTVCQNNCAAKYGECRSVGCSECDGYSFVCSPKYQ